jgi:hypothetical protein
VGEIVTKDATVLKSLLIGAGISASVALCSAVCVCGYLFMNHRNSDVVGDELNPSVKVLLN